MEIGRVRLLAPLPPPRTSALRASHFYSLEIYRLIPAERRCVLGLLRYKERYSFETCRVGEFKQCD
jgi:hypothetical protein